VYIDVEGTATAWQVIRNMNVRGAPLIAITAALGLAVEANKWEETQDDAAGGGSIIAQRLEEKMQYLRTSRPTAVNLFNAMDALGEVVRSALDEGASAQKVCAEYIKAAEKMLLDDVSDNRSIGRHGAEAILAKAGKTKVRIMTVCNTGSLASAGYGTALGVARYLHEQGSLEEIVALETRPYNQGSRLTAFEIMEEQMPGRLITDNMAASFMRRQGCDAVVVGADRVCRNGDTANKIGTYMLAVLAKHHNVPFFVAAPTTSVDLTLTNGDGIPIEERKASELLDSSGAPEGMPVWNPAFDVTPGELVTGIITERGVVVAGEEGIDCEKFIRDASSKNP